MASKRAQAPEIATCDEGASIQSIDGRICENSYCHHTDDYESDALIIRRGQPFTLKLNLNKAAKIDLGRIFVHLKTGKRPKKRNGTWIQIGLKTDEGDDEWYFSLLQEGNNMVDISVNVPSNALVSKYALTVESTEDFSAKKSLVETPYNKDVFILFNPWCETDEVYMESDELKEEYVMNDKGCVYWSYCRPKPWFFGQFTDAVLRCTFNLLEKSYASRRDTALEVARDISAKANHYDNDGLLVGNWSGDYSGGVKPWQWTGSVKIFKKYLETGEPVEFGQCWVFSGIVTSMMRTVGIPCRSVTNYSSAHDTDNNCTFDKYFDEEMNYLEDESDDSCWNFHVWNDVWMARPDLPDGMGGWQAVDGTPQEESKGIYRCGPASLQAIKEGNVHYNYDTKFVFAEVNADTVYWQRTKDSRGREDWEAVRVKGNSVGKDISTKAPNSPFRSDITQEYKFKEGSMLERAAVKNALKRSRNPVIEKKPTTVTFSSKLPYESDCNTGVELIVSAKNKTSEECNIFVAVTGQLVRYTGVTLQRIRKRIINYKLAGEEDHDFKFFYDPSEYINQLDENVALRLSFMAKVEETKQTYVSQKISNLQKPDLSLELVNPSQSKVKAGDVVNVKVTFPQVCNIGQYTNCVLNIDGSVVVDDSSHNVKNLNVSGGCASVIQPITVKNKLKNNKTYDLVIGFDSDELSGVTGTLEFVADV